MSDIFDSSLKRGTRMASASLLIAAAAGFGTSSALLIATRASAVTGVEKQSGAATKSDRSSTPAIVMRVREFTPEELSIGAFADAD